MSRNSLQPNDPDVLYEGHVVHAAWVCDGSEVGNSVLLLCASVCWYTRMVRRHCVVSVVSEQLRRGCSLWVLPRLSITRGSKDPRSNGLQIGEGILEAQLLTMCVWTDIDSILDILIRRGVFHKASETVASCYRQSGTFDASPVGYKACCASYFSRKPKRVSEISHRFKGRVRCSSCAECMSGGPVRRKP